MKRGESSVNRRVVVRAGGEGRVDPIEKRERGGSVFEPLAEGGGD